MVLIIKVLSDRKMCCFSPLIKEIQSLSLKLFVEKNHDFIKIQAKENF